MWSEVQTQGESRSPGVTIVESHGILEKVPRSCTRNQRKKQAATPSQGEMSEHFKLAAQIQGSNYPQSLFFYQGIGRASV